MKPETLYMVLAIIVALCTIAGMFVGLARWLGKVERNTEATEKLTASFDKFSDRTADTLADHEVRISIIESSRRP